LSLTRTTFIDDDDEGDDGDEGDGDGDDAEQRGRRCARDVVRCVDVVAWKKKNRDEDDENAGSL
jgi:hypothetical protein